MTGDYPALRELLLRIEAGASQALAMRTFGSTVEPTLRELVRRIAANAQQAAGFFSGDRDQPGARERAANDETD